MKKNFFKKLSFVLALAMIVSVLAPAAGAFAAKAPKLNATSTKYLHLGVDGKDEFDFNISNKVKGWKYLWSSSDEDVAEVNEKNGVTTATGAGTAKISVVITDKDGEEFEELTGTVTVRDNIKELTISNKPEGDKLAVDASFDFNRSYVTAAGKTKGTSGITRWSVNSKDATISDTGLFTATKAGEYTITARAFQSKAKYSSWLTDATKYASYVTSNEATYTVTVGVDIKEVKATKANVLTVTFGKAVDTTDVALAVTRGTTAVASTTTWSEDKTVATVTTTANMISGTHTVTATSKADATMKATGTVEITAQKVAEIKILSGVALTGSLLPGANDSKRAYVYYDVVDQYGQSLRTTSNLQWSFSAQRISENKATGLITLGRSDGNAFTFNEQIYISAVDTKTGVAVTKTVTIGQKQALNSIELAGYLKKGTTEIVKQLPAGFQDATYYMLYTTKDQNGNAFVTNTPVASNEITLIADNALLISKIRDGETKINLAGVEYNAVFVTPGINVDKGGEVNITAIANNTGNKVVINTAIGAYQILTSFNMSTPASILADGETVDIPFEALDQDGKKIANFTTIARNATFNKLTFNTTFGTLKLAENADGTAKLTYADNTTPLVTGWTSATTTDGQDRVVSLTSIVVGGNTSSQMLSIQDKARPVGISSVKMDAATVEAGTIVLNLSDTDDNSFTFVDQYGRVMTRTNASVFFAGSPANFATHNNEFAGYTFAVRATYKGDAGVFTNGGAVANNAEYQIVNGATQTFTAGTNVTVSAKSGMAYDFEVVKHTANGADGVLGNADDGFASAQAVSPKVTKASTVVDITSVKAYAIKDMDKIFVQTTLSNSLTGITGGLTSVTVVGAATLAADSIPTAYEKTVEVTGVYNGVSVKIPAPYITVLSDKLVSDATNKIVAAQTWAAAVSGGAVEQGFRWSNFYDATTAQYTRKDTTDTIKATITQVYNFDNTNPLVPVALPIFVVDSASKAVTISDEAPKATTITGKDIFTVAPVTTQVTTANLSHADRGNYKVKDQYNVDFAAPITYRVTAIVEAKEGYATNNFKVTGNDSNAVTVNGAERLDAFDLVVKAGNATFTSKVVVGADDNANISNGANNYLDILLNSVGALEAQRQAGLN